MTKTEKDKARAELDHALAALGDGAGQSSWGPGVIGMHLWERSPAAGTAFDCGCQFAWQCIKAPILDAFVPKSEIARYVRNARSIAPVMLEILLEGEE